MPKISDLARLMGEATGVPKRTVDQLVRFLRADGLLPKTPGGSAYSGGASATAREGAVLLVALLGTDTALNAPEAVRRFGAFRYAETRYRHLTAEREARWLSSEPLADDDGANTTFLDFLELLIRSYQNGTAQRVPRPPAHVGIDRDGGRLSCFVDFVDPKNINGGVFFASGIYHDPNGDGGQVSPARLQKTAIIPGAIFPLVANLLGPIPLGEQSAQRADASSPEHRLN